MIDHEAPGDIIDTHAHLDDSAFDEDRDAVIAASRAAGVTNIINIGYRPTSWDTSRLLRERYEGISIALGLHPHHADEYTPEFDKLLIEAIDSLHPVAVGETGFDLTRNSPPILLQEQSFRSQIEISLSEGLPLIIHQRNASDALLTELARWPELASIVLHSFDGNRRLTEWAIDRGCYFGVGGLATRAGSAGLRELLRKVPLHRVLLETDAPYLAPPTSASRRNTPANLPAIADILASLWAVSPQELCRQTSINARALFGAALGGIMG